MIGRHKRLFIAAVVALVLVAGVATAALAQTPPPNATPGTQQESQGVKYGQVFLDKLASLLGVERQKLDASIKDAGKATADEAVKNGDLTQKQADALKNRIDQGQPGAVGPFGFDKGGRFGEGFGERGLKGASVDIMADVQKAITDKLGMTTDELVTELKSGKKLADVLTEMGVSETDLRAAVVDAVKPKLDQAVTDGNLTQKQADAIVTAIQDGKFPVKFGMMWGKGGHGWGKPGQPSPEATPAPSSSS